MEWIPLNQQLPTGKEDVLACDWLYNEYRIMVCDAQADPVYSCEKKTKNYCLRVKHSLLAAIGDGKSAHWMKMPKENNKNWKAFNLNKLPTEHVPTERDFLVQLFNGNYYVVHFSGLICSPTFWGCKFISLFWIKKWMKLPDPPLSKAKILIKRLIRKKKIKK